MLTEFVLKLGSAHVRLSPRKSSRSFLQLHDKDLGDSMDDLGGRDPLAFFQLGANQLQILRGAGPSLARGM